MFRAGKPTFAALHSVPWAELHHAYGSAADIPDHLRRLASGDRQAREAVLYSLYGNIFHQGSVYPATVAAVPFLIEALLHEGMPDRDQILTLLAHLAAGFPEDLVVKGLDAEALVRAADPLAERQAGGEEDDGDADPAALAEYAEVARQVYAEVGAGCPVYTALLDAGDANLQVHAAFLLAWFPAHGWAAATKLLELARGAADPLVQSSCLLALSHMAGRQARASLVGLATGIVEQARRAHTPGRKCSWPEATACFCLLRENYRAKNRDVPPAARELAESCVRDGVDFPGGEGTAFPWGDVTRHLHTVVRKLLKKRKRKGAKSEDAQEAGGFDFDALVSRLPAMTGPGEAVGLARMLLAHAFGEKDVMSFADYADRTLPAENWNDEQRQVLQSIADCPAAWPEIAFFLQESLEIDFEPTRQELQSALAGPAAVAPEPAEPPPSAEPPDEAAVVAAVRRLADTFTRSDKVLDAELKRFERFRPYAAAGLPVLVEQLRAKKRRLREAAAWALGRLGPCARPALPALFEAWRRDPENEYTGFAIADIGLDDFGPLVEMMRSGDGDACDLFADMKDVPEELVQSLLTEENPELRRAAVGKLRFAAAPRHVPRFLELLDDPDEYTAGQARYGLKDAGPDCLPAVLQAAAGASARKRRLLAEVLADFSRHLAPHAGSVAAWLQGEADPGARAALLNALAALGSVPADVAAALAHLASAPDGATRTQALWAVGRLAAVAADELAPVVIRAADGDPDPHVRAAAVQALRSFRRPEAEVLAALERSLTSASQSVRLQAIWSLYYRGQEGVPPLVRVLSDPTDDRVTAEAVWALGLAQATAAAAAVAAARHTGSPLTASLAGWALERIGGAG